jgi:hypothetical protein
MFFSPQRIAKNSYNIFKNGDEVMGKTRSGIKRLILEKNLVNKIKIGI